MGFYYQSGLKSSRQGENTHLKPWSQLYVKQSRQNNGSGLHLGVKPSCCGGVTSMRLSEKHYELLCEVISGSKGTKKVGLGVMQCLEFTPR